MTKAETAKIMATLWAAYPGFYSKAGNGDQAAPDELTAMEAWNLVAKALRNSAYGSEEEFAKLPPAVQRVAHSPSQLREWALMDADTVQSVVASNFQRAYTARQKSDREFEALPPAVRQYVAALTEGESVLKRLEG